VSRREWKAHAPGRVEHLVGVVAPIVHPLCGQAGDDRMFIGKGYVTCVKCVYLMRQREHGVGVGLRPRRRKP
jgi:hypothetical protein